MNTIFGNKVSTLLVMNGGSSSIRFSLYENKERLARLLTGKIDRIGARGTNLHVMREGAKTPDASLLLNTTEKRRPAEYLIRWLEQQFAFNNVTAVGHRVVHGMKHSQPELVTPALIEELHRIIPYDPDHLPSEIALIETIGKRHPKLAQFACFDTAFHRTMPIVARQLAIPRVYFTKGVERYGFHGLSYSYLMEELDRLGDTAARKGRVILAHLGSGASLAAVLDGNSIDTSMAFTPAAGLVMGTRSGDLDPGIFSFLARSEKITRSQYEVMINHRSGLLGISETSSDVRDLLKIERSDDRAREALDLFCYQARKWIGAFAASLGGLDTLVFAGGIGENAPVVRERICRELKFLGIQLSDRRNVQNAEVISTPKSRVTVRVIATNEELMIARSVFRAEIPRRESVHFRPDVTQRF